MILKKGYIQVYTGDGKGKTTAATGLALRMLGRGGKVFLGRFMKGRESGELKGLMLWRGFSCESYGGQNFIFGKPEPTDIDVARHGLSRVGNLLESGIYDLMILDEILGAIAINLFSEAEVLSLLSKKPATTELVLTGRNASPAIIERAHLVTEMQAVKHYYQAGVPARTGIEE
jgi:cob(I)alamin adenosyltransferase